MNTCSLQGGETMGQESNLHLEVQDDACTSIDLWRVELMIMAQGCQKRSQ